MAPRGQAPRGPNTCRVPVPVGDASRFPQLLGPGSQAPGSGVAGLPATNAPTLRYTHAHASLPRRFSPGGSDLTLKPALALPAPALGTGNLPPRGPRTPALRELGLSIALLGLQGSLGKTRDGYRARVRRGEGPGPPAPAVCMDRMAGSPSAHSPYPAASLPARSARVCGPAPLPPPFWLVISSSPRPACQARTAHLSLGAQPNRLPFFPGREGLSIRCLDPHLKNIASPAHSFSPEAARLAYDLVTHPLLIL